MQAQVLETESDAEPTVTRQVDIAAPVEDVWEAISTDEGRERWLECDDAREVVVEHVDPPRRIAWWWWSGDEPARRVDFRVVSIPSGTRVIVTETAPAGIPIASMVAACVREPAFA